MTDTPGATSPVELAEKLEKWAQERADAALHHASRGDYSIAGKCEADEDRLRAAASMLREMEAYPDLLDAAREFVAKVERGEARSKRSYAAFKEALEKADRRAAKALERK